MEISEKNLKLIEEALATQVRLLDARINKTDRDRLRIYEFSKLLEDVRALILKQ